MIPTGSVPWRGSCSAHLCLAAKLRPNLGFAKAKLVWVQLPFTFFYFFFFSFLPESSSQHIVSGGENAPVRFIAYLHPGLELVIPPLAHSCSFSGIIITPSQGPHRSSKTAQISFQSHLIQLRCQDLALKLAKYISLGQIRYGFFLLCVVI